VPAAGGDALAGEFERLSLAILRDSVGAREEPKQA